jgi:signal transduction histidine kinase
VLVTVALLSALLGAVVAALAVRARAEAAMARAEAERDDALRAAAGARAAAAAAREAAARAEAGNGRSRPERNEVTPRPEPRPVEMVPVIEAALAAIRPAASARGVTLAAVLVPRAGVVAGDAGRLEQAVWHLLSNAVKSTDRGGRVEVRLEAEDGGVVVRVKDTGQGIPAERLPGLFDRAGPEDGAAARANGGLGPGLALVRHVVEAHGGSVAAESAGPGRGATFTLRLPVGAARRRPADDGAGAARGAADERKAGARPPEPGAGAGGADR